MESSTGNGSLRVGRKHSSSRLLSKNTDLFSLDVLCAISNSCWLNNEEKLKKFLPYIKSIWSSCEEFWFILKWICVEMGYFGFINRWGRIEIILIIKKPGSRAGFALTCYVTLGNSITMCQFFYLNIEGTKLDHFPSSSTFWNDFSWKSCWRYGH